MVVLFIPVDLVVSVVPVFSVVTVVSVVSVFLLPMLSWLSAGISRTTGQLVFLGCPGRPCCHGCPGCPSCHSLRS